MYQIEENVSMLILHVEFKLYAIQFFFKYYIELQGEELGI